MATRKRNAVLETKSGSRDEEAKRTNGQGSGMDRGPRQASSFAKNAISSILEEDQGSSTSTDVLVEDDCEFSIKRRRETTDKGPMKKNAETAAAKKQKNKLAKDTREAKKVSDAQYENAQMKAYQRHEGIRNVNAMQAETEKLELPKEHSANCEITLSKLSDEVATLRKEKIQLEKEIQVLKEKNGHQDDEIKILVSEKTYFATSRDDLQTRLTIANEKLLKLKDELDAEKLIKSVESQTGMAVLDVREFSDAINKLPSMIEKLQSMLCRPEVVNASIAESGIAFNIEESTGEMGQCSQMGNLVFSSDPDERWNLFDEQVAALKEKPASEYKHAIINSESGPELHDIGKGGGNPNMIFANKTLLSRALSNSSEIHTYAVQAFDAVFRIDVAIFCTCSGTTKGMSPDGHARAGLPPRALEIFIDHCIRVAKKANWAMKAKNNETRSLIIRKINVSLNNSRKKYGFEPTPEQLKEYNKKMCRGEQNKKKKGPVPPADEPQNLDDLE